MIPCCPPVNHALTSTDLIAHFVTPENAHHVPKASFQAIASHAQHHAQAPLTSITEYAPTARNSARHVTHQRSVLNALPPATFFTTTCATTHALS